MGGSCSRPGMFSSHPPLPALWTQPEQFLQIVKGELEYIVNSAYLIPGEPGPPDGVASQLGKDASWWHAGRPLMIIGTCTARRVAVGRAVVLPLLFLPGFG
jgi:hypothetical protein